MAIAPKLKNIEAGMLVELLDQLANQDNSNLTHDSLAAAIQYPVMAQFLVTTTELLEQKGYVSSSYDTEDDVYRISITHEGVDFVQAAEDNPESDIHNYISEFHPASVDKQDAPDSNAKPESTDEAWEPLPIDRERPTYSELVECLNAAKDAIRHDNGYSASHPEERDEIIQNLTLGTETIEEKESVTRHFVETKLLQPLKRVMTVFNKAALGELAKVAIAAIKAYFFPGA